MAHDGIKKRDILSLTGPPVPAEGDEALLSAAGSRQAGLLHMMNKRHALIANYGSKARVTDWIIDKYGRQTLDFVAPDEIRMRYCNQFVPGKDGDSRTPLGSWWLRHRDRRQYDGVRFEPGNGEAVIIDHTRTYPKF